MVNKNRILLVARVEHITICLKNLNTSGYLLLAFDSGIKGVQREW